MCLLCQQAGLGLLEAPLTLKKRKLQTETPLTRPDKDSSLASKQSQKKEKLANGCCVQQKVLDLAWLPAVLAETGFVFQVF